MYLQVPVHIICAICILHHAMQRVSMGVYYGYLRIHSTRRISQLTILYFLLASVRTSTTRGS